MFAVSKVLSKLKKFTREESFNPQTMAQYSAACQSLCQWVLAVEKYAAVYRIVQPKRKAYAEVRDKLELVRERLRAKEGHLAKVKSE